MVVRKSASVSTNARNLAPATIIRKTRHTHTHDPRFLLHPSLVECLVRTQQKPRGPCHVLYVLRMGYQKRQVAQERQHGLEEFQILEPLVSRSRETDCFAAGSWFFFSMWQQYVCVNGQSVWADVGGYDCCRAWWCLLRRWWHVMARAWLSVDGGSMMGRPLFCSSLG